MSQTIEKKEQRYTYADYLQWNDGKRWELICGIAIDMTPSPSRQHQKILGDLHNQFYNYLRNKSCEVYIAPFDVRLSLQMEVKQEKDTVLQPDLSVVCDPDKLDDRGCNGAPDLVIEILSPVTAKRDLTVKLTAYERAGVREYWVVHPGDKTVMIFNLNAANEYSKPTVYGEGDIIQVSLFEGLFISLESAFS